MDIWAYYGIFSLVVHALVGLSCFVYILMQMILVSTISFGYIVADAAFIVGFVMGEQEGNFMFHPCHEIHLLMSLICAAILLQVD